jgi:hypothetical protein
MRRHKKSRLTRQQQYEKEYGKQLQKQSRNRRKLLSKLKPEVREFAIAEFAKLGLYQ